MHSMTGFGHAELSLTEADISVEVKTTNGRYLDVMFRLPREMSFFEAELRKVVQEMIRRGRVEVFMNLVLKSENQLEVDQSLLESYLSLAEKVRSRAENSVLDVFRLLQLPGVVKPRLVELGMLLPSLRSVVREAITRVLEVRREEGAAINRDLERRLNTLARLVAQIQEGADAIREYYRTRLKQRVEELNRDPAIDENRLAQEILFYAERYDISEEITRLLSHVERFREYLDVPEESVGKSLDFLCQEMNREMNTILSKSPLAELSRLGVEGKAEIEKIREQVQNVE
ncbi:MAG: YicC family protein [Acidobacteria bacterium]|nr:YicC family protein [Acidobacteriota bacterium]